MYKKAILGKVFYFVSPATGDIIDQLLARAADGAAENDCVCYLELACIIDRIDEIDWHRLNKKFAGFIKVDPNGLICN